LYSSLEGVYFYADFCTGRIWGASLDASGSWNSEQVLDTDLSITSFGEDEDGELYLAHFSSTNGTIYRVTEPVPMITDPAPPKNAGSGGGGGCFISIAALF
jgi:hypothetical protein